MWKLSYNNNNNNNNNDNNNNNQQKKNLPKWLYLYHRVKLKESEKRDKNFDLARELKKYETWKWW